MHKSLLPIPLAAFIVLCAAQIVTAQAAPIKASLSFSFEESAAVGVSGKAQVLSDAPPLTIEWKGAPRGGLAFWFQPNWDGEDTAQRYFLEAGDVGAPHSIALRKLKDGRGQPYLQLVIWDDKGAPFTCDAWQIKDWKRGEWHHIALAWRAENTPEDLLLLAVDGKAWAGVKRRPLNWKAPVQWRFGNAAANLQWHADGLLDELHFYDETLSLDHIAALYGAMKPPTLSTQPATKPIAAAPATTEKPSLLPEKLSLLPVMPLAQAALGGMQNIALNMDGFRETYSGQPESAAHPTRSGVAWDETHLYVKVRAEKPRGEALQSHINGRDGAVWNDDSIEVFVAPPDETAAITHLIINSKNVVFDSKIDRTQSMESAAWNGTWKSEVTTGDDFYEVTLSLPWKELGGVPGTQKEWRLNIARNRPGAPVVAWAPTSGILNRPAWFGFLQLRENATENNVLRIASAERAGMNALIKFAPLPGLTKLIAARDGKIIATQTVGGAKNLALKIPLVEGDQTLQLSAQIAGKTIAAERRLFAHVARVLSVRASQWAYWKDEKNAALVLDGEALQKNGPLRVALTAIPAGKKTEIALLQNAALAPGTTPRRREIAFDVSRLAPGRYTLNARLQAAGEKEVFNASNEILVLSAPPPFAPRAAVQSARVLSDNSGAPIRLNDAPMLPISMHWLSPHHGNAPFASRTGIDIAAAFIDGDNLDDMQKQLDDFSRAGLMAHLHFDKPYFMERQPGGQMKPREGRIEAAVQRFKNHPALFGWYLFDEPNNLTPSGDFVCEPAELEKVHQLIKRLDDRHFTVVTCSNGSDFAAYKNTCDVMSTDVYPIPDVPITTISEAIQKARRETGKPVWAVVQSAWLRPGQRAVLPHEVLSQAHLALVHGAAALGFYNWDGHNVPAENALRAEGYYDYQRSAYKVLQAQRKALLPALAKDQNESFTFGGQAFTGLAETKTIHARALRHGDEIFFIAVNVTNQPASLRATFPSLSTQARAEVLPENRFLVFNQKTLNDTLKPLESRVYRITR